MKVEGFYECQTAKLQMMLGAKRSADYTCQMEDKAHTATSPAPAVLFSLVLLVGIAGFGGWFATGDDLFMALIQTGMRWCF